MAEGEDQGFDGKAFYITRVELEQLMLTTARTAVQECQVKFMVEMGLNIANAADIKEYRDTIAWASTLRHGSVKVGGRLMMTIITVITGAVAISAWEYFKALWWPHP